MSNGYQYAIFCSKYLHNLCVVCMYHNHICIFVCKYIYTKAREVQFQYFFFDIFVYQNKYIIKKTALHC